MTSKLNVHKLLSASLIPFCKQTNLSLSNFLLIMAVESNLCLGFDILIFKQTHCSCFNLERFVSEALEIQMAKDDPNVQLMN